MLRSVGLLLWEGGGVTVFGKGGHKHLYIREPDVSIWDRAGATADKRGVSLSTLAANALRAYLNAADTNTRDAWQQATHQEVLRKLAQAKEELAHEPRPGKRLDLVMSSQTRAQRLLLLAELDLLKLQAALLDAS